MTIKEIDKVLSFGSSHLLPIQGFPIGVSKWQVFSSIKPIIKGKKYWYALRKAFTMSDNLYHYRHDVRLAFLSKEPQIEYLMTDKEKIYLNTLPEKITIYRAMTENEFKQKDFGISWTLKKDIAEFFVNSYNRNYETNHLKSLIHETIIDKNQVTAFFNDRNEFEIIYIKKEMAESLRNF